MKDTTLIFLRKEDKLLLAMKKRGFGEGRWNGIGGKIETGESAEEAAVRETEEEIGVKPIAFHQVADISFDQHYKGERTLMNMRVFIATEWQGEPAESEEMRPEWYQIDNLPYDSMWPDDPYWLPLVLEGKKIKASFVMDINDNITKHSIKEVSGL